MAINSEYCRPNPINLKIDTEGGTYLDNELVFSTEKPRSLHKLRVIYDVTSDGSRNPIFTLYKKKMTVHGRCQVFRGNSTDKKDLLFSAKRPKMMPSERNAELHVFLAKNIKGSVCDFKLKAGSSKASCHILTGNSHTILAEMENKDGWYVVSVNANIDHAFIVALLLIVGDMKCLEVKAFSRISAATRGLCNLLFF